MAVQMVRRFGGATFFKNRIYAGRSLGGTGEKPARASHAQGVPVSTYRLTSVLSCTAYVWGRDLVTGQNRSRITGLLPNHAI